MKLKARDLRVMTIKDLGEKAAGLEEELFNLRFQASMGQLSNPLRLRIVRKDAARVKTVLGEKKRGEKAAASALTPAVAPKQAVQGAPKQARKETPREEAPKETVKKTAKKAAKKAVKKTTKKVKQEK